MANKTEITIEGDSIVYNGVRYEKVKAVPSEQPFKLRGLFSETLEDAIRDLGYLGDFDALTDHVDTIATHLLEEMTQHIPDYSDWENAMDEICDKMLSEDYKRMFQLGWNAYCKKMWDMINE